jgi:hypothetical protein
MLVTLGFIALIVAVVLIICGYTVAPQALRPGWGCLILAIVLIVLGLPAAHTHHPRRLPRPSRSTFADPALTTQPPLSTTQTRLAMAARSTTIRDRHRRTIAKTQPPCGICGQPIDYTLPHTDLRSYVVDHILPIHKGGDDALANKQAAHRRPRLQPRQIQHYSRWFRSAA